MKKVFLMVAFALTTLTISAQDDAKFTVKAGLGMSSVVGSDADTKATFSYKVGIDYSIACSEAFAVVPGLEFVSKGFKSDNIDGVVSMRYIQIPIMAKYSFKLSDKVKLGIKAGPYASYGISGSDLYFYGSSKKTNIFDSDGGFNRFDAGVIAGVSVDFSMFTVGLEYSRGFTKLDSDYSQFNQAYGLTFGYKF